MLETLLIVWACAVYSVRPAEHGLITHHVGQIEINHVLTTDVDGRVTGCALSQVIFWELSQGVWRVCDWRMYDTVKSPVYDETRHQYYVRWTEANVIHTVYAPMLRERATTYDPELRDRDAHPLAHRRAFRK